MTFTRGVFAFALVMLILGIVGSKFLVGLLFGSYQGPALPPIVAASTGPSRTAQAPAHHHIPSRTSAHPAQRSTPPRPQQTRPSLARRAAPAGGASTTKPPVQLRIVERRTAATAHRARLRRTARPRIVATPAPAPTPTPGVVGLTRYWVGTLQARRGNTIEVGYVIDNETGHPARVMLGASLKSSRALSWARAAVNDPSHDVVAIVPPGVSTHVRFFTLPSGLHPGRYDVAWGLRNSQTGQPVALVVAPDALRATR